jgi:hypothetical protein
VLGELIAYLRLRRNWALLLIVILLFLISLLLVLTEGSALAPFIYPLF